MPLCMCPFHSHVLIRFGHFRLLLPRFIADEEATWRTCSANGEADGCTTVADMTLVSKAVLEPLFVKFKVDM